MKDLQGRLAFVTAGANGIGLGMARAFAGAGMNLALVDIDEAALASATAELAQVTGVKPFLTSVTDRAALAAAADDAESEFGSVAILCNNVGSSGTGIELPPDQMNYDLWDTVLDLSLGSTVNGVQTFLPRMLARHEPAHIVNTASQAGLVASHGGRMYMYTTAKFGVVGLSEALHELLAGTNVGVTLLCPGYTWTNSTKHALENLASQGLPPDIEASERVRLQNLEDTKRKYGRSPDDVGREVLEAVIGDRFYLHTSRRVETITARMQAIIDSMPAETDRDRALASFLSH